MTDEPTDPRGVATVATEQRPESPLKRPPARARDQLAVEVVEYAGPAIASLALVGVVYSVSGVDALVGFVVSWYITFVAFLALVTWQIHGVEIAKDRLAHVFVWSGVALAVAPAVSLLVFALSRGGSAVVSHFPHFFVDDLPASGAPGSAPSISGPAGIGPAIIGSIEQVGLALLVAVPLSLAGASWLAGAPGRVASFVRALSHAMAGAPAIIAGLFVFLLWVQPRGGHGSGIATSLALAVLAFPLLVRALARELDGAAAYRDTALALGATRGRATVRALLPCAGPALIGATAVVTARVLGEAAPALLTAGHSASLNLNPVHGGQSSLPLAIANAAVTPGSTAYSVAWGAALVLLAGIAVFLVTGRAIALRGARRRHPREVPVPVIVEVP